MSFSMRRFPMPNFAANVLPNWRREGTDSNSSRASLAITEDVVLESINTRALPATNCQTRTVRFSHSHRDGHDLSVARSSIQGPAVDLITRALSVVPHLLQRIACQFCRIGFDAVTGNADLITVHESIIRGGRSAGEIQLPLRRTPLLALR
jgi:hypothetical protein